MGGIPQRLEKQIRKPQRQQVLDGFLAEIMIDPVNPVFRKCSGDGVVDDPARRQIDPERLFKPDARIALGQTAGLQALDRRFEKAWRGRQEYGQPLLRRSHLASERIVAFERGRIERLIAQPV